MLPSGQQAFIISLVYLEGAYHKRYRFSFLPIFTVIVKNLVIVDDTVKLSDDTMK